MFSIHQINAQRNAMNELNEKLISREEEIEQLKTKMYDQESAKSRQHEVSSNENINYYTLGISLIIC